MCMASFHVFCAVHGQEFVQHIQSNEVLQSAFLQLRSSAIEKVLALKLVIEDDFVADTCHP